MDGAAVGTEVAAHCAICSSVHLCSSGHPLSPLYTGGSIHLLPGWFSQLAALHSLGPQLQICVLVSTHPYPNTVGALVGFDVGPAVGPAVALVG